MKKIMKRLRYVKISDLLAPFIFLFVLFPAMIYRCVNKIIKKRIWLICEDGKSARDNGYHFFKYIRNNHSNDYCYYVIDKNSEDYNKVAEYGNIVQFGSLKHWFLYLSSEYNISNHKHGNPCQSFFYVIHVILNLFNNRVFLQHGITINDSPWIYYKNTKFKYFVCGAKKEYDFIKEKFGYPEKNVIYTGFARFDNLHDIIVDEKQLVIMPTWRNWLGGNYFTEKQFLKTEYYNRWNSLLNSHDFSKFIEDNGIIVYFYPHQHVQKFINSFTTSSKNIKIVTNADCDIQDLLIKSKYMITDYSSVLMDFAFMGKAAIYYQFDREEYRSKQLAKGFFDYDEAFGPVVLNEKELLEQVKNIYKNGMENEYINRINDFFELRDNNNCERIYNILSEGETNYE